MVNDSLLSGSVPRQFKAAVVTHLVKKKTGLDGKNLKKYLKNHLPVSSLPFLSKVLEKVVLHQLRSHLLANNLSETFQSVYCAHHSMETALLDVMNCLLGSADERQVSILTLLNLSAAFDTLDHSILLTRLHDMFGISGKAFEWFSSYLSDRFQSVSINSQVSSQKKLHYRVLQGSVLGPKLFTLYTQPLSDIISQRKCNHHIFADDTQLHKSSAPSDFHSLIHDIEQWVDSVGSWITCNRLKLNNDKTEALVVGSRRRVSVSQDSHLIFLSKAMSKASGFTLTLPCKAY